MRVLVTGANGHVGYNLCQALVTRPAVELRASVRSLNDAAKTAPLRALGGLELVGLDVRDAAQFARALVGVDTLYHVAANYTVVTRDAAHAAEVVRDSVEGVTLALRAAARAGVSKVVLTSSVVAVPLAERGGRAMTEADWLEGSEVPYVRAKLEGERAAWKLSAELGVPLVSVLPGGVGGPGFARRTPTIDLLEGLMLGTMRFGAPRANFTYVDARDLAEAHILAAERPVSGRFIVNTAEPTFAELGRVMHDLDDEVPDCPWELPELVNRWLPWLERMNAALLGSPRFVTPEGARTLRGHVYHVSCARAHAELGWQPVHSLRESLRDTMRAIRALRRAEGKRRMA